MAAAPACRHADGTISSSSVLDVRRMASEDSEQLRSGLLMVHGLHDLDHLHQTFVGSVLAGCTQLHTLRELHKVAMLVGAQRMPLKEGDNHLAETIPICHGEPPQVLLVVVAAPIDAQ